MRTSRAPFELSERTPWPPVLWRLPPHDGPNYHARLEEFHERRLEFWRQAVAHGHLGALREVLIHCRERGRPVSDWAWPFALDVYEGRLSFPKWLKQHRQRMIESHHTYMVEAARDYARSARIDEPFASWAEVYKVVSEELQGSPYAASPRTIKANYERFIRLSAEDPFQYLEIENLNPRK
jgi:hypothetical protein